MEKEIKRLEDDLAVIDRGIKTIEDNILKYEQELATTNNTKAITENLIKEKIRLDNGVKQRKNTAERLEELKYPSGPEKLNE